MNGYLKRHVPWVLLGLISQTAFATHTENIRQKRYCEIVVSDRLLSLSVYTTFGLNDCPEAAWKKISEKEVKKDTSALFVRLNGPRYWVIDGFDFNPIMKPEKITIGGLEMRKAGILHLKIWDVLHGDKTYREHHVKRQTTWIYKAGNPVYELVGPNGDVYVMQSYSVQKKPLTAASLNTLATQLTLPEGWIYKTGILKEDKYLKTVNNEATVLQDNYLNTYQKSSHDFLE